jgi:hypothetical protein
VRSFLAFLAVLALLPNAVFGVAIFIAFAAAVLMGRL